MLMLFIFVNLLSVFICYNCLLPVLHLSLCLLTISHIFLCFCRFTVIFVLSVLNIIHVLDLESV
jgi:hypothetical protein